MPADSCIPIQGFLDNVSSSEVAGWVADTDHAKPVTVTLEVDGNIVGATEAREFRSATKHLGFHPTGHCGFRFLLGPADAIRPGSTVRVLVANVDAELGNSPWQYLPATRALYHARGESYGNARVFFMHIPKTAGTTLNVALLDRFHGHRTATHIESTSWGRDHEAARSYDFVSGHVRIAQLSQRIDLSDYLRITLLREPFAQLASHLAWVRSVADDHESDFYKAHGLHIQSVARRLRTIDFSSPRELELFVESMTSAELELFDNCQTRYFLTERLEGRITTSELESATETLATIDLAGVVERYDDFLARLCRRLDWDPIRNAPRLNVSTERYGLDVHDVATRTILGSLVGFDRQMYEIVSERLART